MSGDDIWLSLAISAVSGLLAAVATVWLSLRQFQQQRWWERRLDAYTKVVEALHHMSNALEAYLMATGVGAEPVTGERKATLDAEYSKANANLSRLIDMGDLLLRPRAIRELRSMYAKIGVAGRGEDVPMASDYYADALSAVLECQKRYLLIARHELELTRSFLPLGIGAIGATVGVLAGYILHTIGFEPLRWESGSPGSLTYWLQYNPGAALIWALIGGAVSGLLSVAMNRAKMMLL